MAFHLSFNSISFILMLVTVVFLILSCITSPVTSFGLGSTSSYKYGIFGYCQSSGSCSSSSYPYTLSKIDKSAGWLLAPSTRDTLAKVFIVCPIAAGISFICLVFILLSHFLSTGMIILTLILNILSFIATAIICVIVIITFHPFVAWAGWILVGAAAASLISIALMIATLFHRRPNVDDDKDSEDVDLTKFDNDFNTAGGITLTNPHDETSSLSKDYQFKVQRPAQQNVMGSSMSSSSVYESPQLAHDFTMQNKQSNASLNGSQGKKPYYDDAGVNLVNGPNTPIQTRQQMAPNVVPTIATPTMNDAPMSTIPQLPYPSNNSPLNKPAYNPTDLSVFEHHPVVEGHKPFTELADDGGMNQHQFHRSDEMDSDVDSDFTSVSQRAINPKYNPNQYERPSYGQYPQLQHYQPQSQQNQTSMPPPNSQQQYYSPQPQFYPQGQAPGARAAPAPVQKRPTVSDNVLSNNPDFSLGLGGARRKGGYPNRSAGPRPLGNMPPGGRPVANRPPPNRYNQPQLSFPQQNARISDRPTASKDSPYGMI